MRNRISSFVKLGTALIVCQLVGFIGAAFTVPALGTWYADLRKPSFQPPNGVFGPVWMALYVLMAVAAFLVWRKGLAMPRVRGALGWFLFQLVLNGIWTPVFFGLRSITCGLFFAIALWLALLVTLVRFFPISRTAGILLIPYLAWVTFAIVLNAALALLN